MVHWFSNGMSHLLQMRGLKPITIEFDLDYEVASFTDAWIETFEVELSEEVIKVASFTDAWIETCHQ